jgi:hypothetical protein
MDCRVKPGNDEKLGACSAPTPKRWRAPCVQPTHDIVICGYRPLRLERLPAAVQFGGIVVNFDGAGFHRSIITENARLIQNASFPSFRGARLRAGPESITPVFEFSIQTPHREYGFRACASKSAIADLDNDNCRTRVKPEFGGASRNDELIG